MENSSHNAEAIDIAVQNRIKRGRAIADRSITQDIDEKKFDLIALEGVEIEYANRLRAIGRQAEAIQKEENEIAAKRKANCVRIRLLKQSIHEMEMDLLGGAE